jgi:hypothetical protein
MKVVINSERKHLNANIKLYEKYSEYLGKKLYYYQRIGDRYTKDSVDYYQFKKIEPSTIAIDDYWFKLMASFDDCGQVANIVEIYKNKFHIDDVARNDPNLVKAVEYLQSEFPEWKIVEIPDNVEFEIETEDGDLGGSDGEFIAEKHRIWSYLMYDK